jgi:hypothetical protein
VELDKFSEMKPRGSILANLFKFIGERVHLLHLGLFERAGSRATP